MMKTIQRAGGLSIESLVSSCDVTFASTSHLANCLGGRMKGRIAFTPDEASQISALLAKTRRSTREDQKRFRAKIREIGFYISDFDPSARGFGPADFDALVESGLVFVK